MILETIIVLEAQKVFIAFYLAEINQSHEFFLVKLFFFIGS